MKLSRALLIVLLLHVVAVGGILAFNAIKTRQGSSGPSVAAANPANQPVQSIAKTTASPPPSASAARETATHDQKTGSRFGLKSGTKDPKPPLSSGKAYTVSKGDNPVTIAKKFKVSYDDLLALNHIDDPRKLQIGQKLLIPAKPVKSKKKSE
jgi:LysM repeat protein